MPLINSAFLGESVKIDLACQNQVGLPTTAAASTALYGSSAVWSPSFSMKNFDRVCVLIQAGPLPCTGGDVQGKIYVGDSTTDPTSMSSLSSASIALCTASTAGTFNKIKSFDICFGGTWSSASTFSIVIDGVTFDGATAADATAFLYCASDDTSIPESLATLIPAVCTYLKVDKLASNTTDYRLRVTPKLEGSRVISVASTAKALCPASTDADTWGVRVNAVEGMIEFTANDIVATNSSYTNFAVKLFSSNSSTIPMSAVVIRYGGHAQGNGTAMQAADGSTRTYTRTVL